MSASIEDLCYLEYLKPFQCTHCNRSWIDFGQYQMHMRRHKTHYNRCPWQLALITEVKWRKQVSYLNPRITVENTYGQITNNPGAMACDTGVKRDKFYRCFFCNKICKNGGALKNHSKVHRRKDTDHKIKSKCVKLHLQNRSEVSDNKQNEKKAIYKVAQRNTINQVCKTKLQTAIHVKRDGKKCSNSFICPICGREFSVKQSYKRHLECHYARKNQNQCLYCNLQFENADDLKKHASSFHGIGLANIEYDRKKGVVESTSRCIVLKNVKQLDQYVKKLDDKRHCQKFKCQICGKQCRDNNNLRRHKSRNHVADYLIDKSGDNPIYKCKVSGCKEQFFNKKQRMKHQKEHCLTLPEKCQHCPSMFKTKCDLYRHSRVHTDEKPHRCSYCDQSYKRAGDRNRHERTHLGVHLKKCRFCGRGCRDKHLLEKHERTHTGVKPYGCDLCSDKRYSTKFGLKQHMDAVHSEEAAV